MTKKRKGELIVFWSVVFFAFLCLMQNESIRIDLRGRVEAEENHQHEYEFDLPDHRHNGIFGRVINEEISE